MAIDLKKMREKLNKLNDKSGGKGKTIQYWKPVEGADSTIRILPTEDGDPLKEFYFHYLRGDDKKFQSVLCPKKNYNYNFLMKAAPKVRFYENEKDFSDHMAAIYNRKNT